MLHDRCKHPKWKVFAARHKLEAGGKRKTSDDDYTAPKTVKLEACQYGCGEKFRSVGDLILHEQECEWANNFRAFGPKEAPRKWEEKDEEEDAASEGSGAEDAQD